MKFHLVDRIESLEPGRRIVTIKALSLAEEYLADHFPAFPVLPGVLMLEAMTQSAAWLVRVAQDFSRSIVVLARARNVRYGSFVAPGKVLRCEVEAGEIGDESSTFKAAGFVRDPASGREDQAISAKLTLRSYNLKQASEEGSSHRDEADRAIIEQLRKRFVLIGGDRAPAAPR